MNDDYLRKLQLTEKGILDDFVRVCEQNGLRYFLNFGTLLGAVRHKGFIPWDDDIDVAMPYEDYKKFLTIGADSLGEKYFLQTTETDSDYVESYAKIRLRGTALLQEGYEPYGTHQEIWIDIFPLVYVNSTNDWDKKRFRIKLANCCNSKAYIKANPDLFRKEYGLIGFAALSAVVRLPRRLLRYIYKKLTGPVFNAPASAMLVEIYPWSCFPVPAEVFLGSTATVEFEGDTYTAPADPVRYLELNYGDWQTPPEDRNCSHRPKLIDFYNDYKA